MAHRFIRGPLAPLQLVGGFLWRCARTVLVFAAALGPAAPPPPPPPVKVKEEDGDAELDDER